MRFHKSVLPVSFLFLLGATVAQAQVTQTVGAGTAVPGTPDRTATFSSVVNGTNLTAYTENSLSITVPNTAFLGFDPTTGSGLGGFSGGFFYGSGGTNAPIIIKTTDSQKLYGLEFNVGSGYTSGGTATHFAYFVFNGVTQIANGAFDVTSGSVLGFSSPTGFDSINIGAYTSLALAQSATPSTSEAAAIDNVKVRLSPSAPATPEPGTWAMFVGMTVSGGLFLKRRKRAVR